MVKWTWPSRLCLSCVCSTCDRYNLREEKNPAFKSDRLRSYFSERQDVISISLTAFTNRHKRERRKPQALLSHTRGVFAWEGDNWGATSSAAAGTWTRAGDLKVTGGEFALLIRRLIPHFPFILFFLHECRCRFSSFPWLSSGKVGNEFSRTQTADHVSSYPITPSSWSWWCWC